MYEKSAMKWKNVNAPPIASIHLFSRRTFCIFTKRWRHRIESCQKVVVIGSRIGERDKNNAEYYVGDYFKGGIACVEVDYTGLYSEISQSLLCPFYTCRMGPILHIPQTPQHEKSCMWKGYAKNVDVLHNSVLRYTNFSKIRMASGLIWQII